ncbi:uncharacterized protein BROUX77_006333 [Berkeleyomyces rouxiae]|uniref:uncharacterized protein n=1 Tax=Berkeleyomyces rouxiae TaxID=2035830 RepID=UPI003B7A2572
MASLNQLSSTARTRSSSRPRSPGQPSASMPQTAAKLSQDTATKLSSTPARLQSPVKPLLSPKKAPGSTVKIRRFADSNTLENRLLGKIDGGKPELGWIDLDKKSLGPHDAGASPSRKMRTRKLGIKPASRGRSMASFLSYGNASDDDEESDFGGSDGSGLDDIVPVLVPKSLKMREDMDADTTLRMNWREPQRQVGYEREEDTVVEELAQELETSSLNETFTGFDSSEIDLDDIDADTTHSHTSNLFQKQITPKKTVASSKSTTKPKADSGSLRKVVDDSILVDDLPGDLEDGYDSDITGFVPSRTLRKQRSASSAKKQGKAPSAREAKKTFEATKHEKATNFLQELDTAITKGKIVEMTKSTGGVEIVWSNKLNTTAGRANWSRKTLTTKKHGDADVVEHKHFASIELATKVIDNEDRLLNVIAHEYCHLANFMINNLRTNPHGREFKVWATQVSNVFGHRGIEVTTRHTYDIDFKYAWECSSCGLEYQRHSKSINPERQRCGKCKSVLVQTRPTPRVASAKPSEYQSFMKRHMKTIKAENPSLKQKDVMKMIGELWAEHNKNKAPATSEPVVVETVCLDSDSDEENVDDLLVAQLTGLTLQK